MIRDRGEGGGGALDRCFELLHRTEVNVLHFSTACAHNVVVIVFVAHLVPRTSADTHWADEVLFDELFK